jgi:uncharacterized OB-fold protein
VICPACGAGNVPGEAFCDYCGSPLDAPVPTAEAAPELEPVSTEAELEAAPEPAVEEVAPAEEPAAEADKLTCSVCGAEVQPDEAFCADCGASLAQAPIPPEPVAEVEEPVVEAAPPPPEPEPVVEEAPPAPVEEVAPPPPPPAAPAAPAAAACPACGEEIEPGDAFCSNCGAAIAAAPPAPEPVEEAPPAPVEEAAPPPPPPTPPAGPRLLVAASGAEIPLPAAAEILIGREDPVSGIYPEVDLTPHGGEDGGVSRRHARLIVEGGNYFVEDLDSTNFTFVNKQKIAPKTRTALKDGDELRCGRVALVLKTG